jgi:UDP-3-O-[3-hydroxymyristoyl] N-acetylglucosamine deacetylase
MTTAASVEVRSRFRLRDHSPVDCVSCEGPALHSGQWATMRVISRGDDKDCQQATGIRFIRTDLAGQASPRVVPAALSNVRTRILRRTAIGASPVVVNTVEHVLAALSVRGIWNADVEFDGEEPPALDGSARKFLDLLEPLGGQAEPEAVRLAWPVGFCRDGRTAMVALPLDDDEQFSEMVAVVNLPRLPVPPSGHFACRYVHSSYAAFGAEIARHPTFVEQPLEQLRPSGLFRGARAYDNILPAYDPGLWSPDRAVRPDGLARHKVLDLLGDWFLLELTLRRRVLARVIAIGSGHRDTHVLTDLVLRSITHGILPGSDFVALLRVVQRQYEGGYVSAELYRYLVARIDRWAGRLKPRPPLGSPQRHGHRCPRHAGPQRPMAQFQPNASPTAV